MPHVNSVSNKGKRTLREMEVHASVKKKRSRISIFMIKTPLENGWIYSGKSYF